MVQITWPAIYIDLDLDEELMVVTHANWHSDVDTHWAIGPITGSNHYFVDSKEKIYRLVGKGSSHFDVPIIEIGESIENPTIIETIVKRALKWSDIKETSVPAIASILAEQEMC